MSLKKHISFYVWMTCGNELRKYIICVGFLFDKMYVWTEWLGSMIDRVSQKTWKLSNEVAYGNPGSFWHKSNVWFFSRILGDCYLVSFCLHFWKLWLFYPILAEKGNKSSQGSSPLKFLKKIRRSFYAKRNQDFHVQFYLTTFMCFGTP